MTLLTERMDKANHEHLLEVVAACLRMCMPRVLGIIFRVLGIYVVTPAVASLWESLLLPGDARPWIITRVNIYAVKMNCAASSQ